MRLIRSNIKIYLDVLMTGIFVLVMSFHVTRVRNHEWFGTILIIFFIIHNFLNFKWYRVLAKGKYTFPRIFRTIVNLGLLVAMMLSGYSGMVLSRHLFVDFPLSCGIEMARKIHLAATCWSLVLTGLHLGMHGTMLVGKLKLQEKKKVAWLFRVLATLISVYGAFWFGNAQIYKNMFFVSQFSLCQSELSAVIVILNNAAMLFLWSFVGYTLSKGCTYVEMKSPNKVRKVVLFFAVGIFMMLLPALFQGKRVNETECTHKSESYHGNDLYERRHNKKHQITD